VNQFKKIIFFGNCAADALCKAFSGFANEAGVSCESFIIAGSSYHFPFFYREQDLVIAFSPRYQEDLCIINGKKYYHPVIFPHPEDINKEYLYCFGGPVYDYALFLKHLTQNSSPEAWMLSDAALKDTLITLFAPLFQFIELLQNKNIKIVLAEGQNIFRPSWEYYENVASVFMRVRRIMKDELKKRGLIFFEIPNELVDESGFTKETFRKLNAPQDFQHPAWDTYWPIYAKHFYNFLEKNCDLITSEYLRKEQNYSAAKAQAGIRDTPTINQHELEAAAGRIKALEKANNALNKKNRVLTEAHKTVSDKNTELTEKYKTLVRNYRKLKAQIARFEEVSAKALELFKPARM